MTTLPSIRALITRLTFVALFLTLTVMMVGCGSYNHVRKGLATDPSWKETPQASPQQVDASKPVAESEEPQ